MTASLSKSTPFETTPNSVSSPQQRAVHIEMNDSEEKRVDEDEWATLRVSLQEATNRCHFSTTTEVEIFETDGETLCNYL